MLEITTRYFSYNIAHIYISLFAVIGEKIDLSIKCI